MYTFLSGIRISIRILMIACLLFVVTCSNVSADSLSEIQNKIDANAVQIDMLNAEIVHYQNQLNSLSTKSNTLANEVKSLDITQKKLEADLKLSETKIKKAENDMIVLGGQIEDKEITIDERSALIAKSIRELEESGKTTLLQMLLSNEKFADGWVRIDNVQTFKEALRSDARELLSAKVVLVDKQSEIQQIKNELLKLRSGLHDQKKILDENVKEKNTLLASTKNQESTYAKMVSEKKALVSAFEAEMRSYEEQLVYIAHPDRLPLAGSAPLSWPVIDPFITQMFGKTIDSVRLYASGSHSGVDFRASVGTPIFAMSSGVVGGSGDTDAFCKGASFGKWVLVRYDNGLASTYGHLSLIKAVNGMRVGRGDIIGYSGATGHVTGPHLHVSMYPSDAVSVEPKESLACKGKILTQPRASTSAYLDPLLYMPKTTSAMFK